MAQNLNDSKPATAEDTTTSSQTHMEHVEAHSKPGFTILRSGSGSSFSTSTGRTSPNQSSSDSQVSGLTKSLEGLEVEDEANDGEDTALDAFLVNALKNRGDRIFLLKLDREFCNFINNPTQKQLEFPPLNSYYRMVIHRVADYFKITRFVGPQQKIILSKTEQTAIPALRFSDLVEEEEEQPVLARTVLKRANRPSSGMSTPDLLSSEPDRRTISIKDREEAYARARARIFQEEVPAKPKSEGSGSNSRSESPSVSTPTAESSKQDGGDDGIKPRARKQGSGRKHGPGSGKSADDLVEGDSRQQNHSLPNSRNVSRSTSPSPSSTTVPTGGSDGNVKPGSKGLGPKNKPSKGDLAAECSDSRRRKSTTSNASSSSGTVKTTPIGLARTISSSSSQDGFQSPGLGPTPTESPPSNMTGSKTFDYFGQNPTSSPGSVSPMSSGSSRTSFTHSQTGGSKQHRNYHGNGGGSGYGAGPTNNNFGNHAASTNFAKGMSAQPFIPKKPHSKHGNNHNNNNNNNNNNMTFNSGPMNAYASGPPNQNHVFNSGASGPYTHPQVNVPTPWADRGMLPGHDAPVFYPNPQQDPSLPFQYGNNVTPYPQPGQNTHPSFNNNHHPNAPNHQHGYHNPSHRGGRRNHTSKPHFGHQAHFHPHHSRTHPPMHAPTQHHGNNYNAPTSGADFAFPQGVQPLRYGRPFDGNTTQGAHQHYVPDFYPVQGMAGDAQGPYPMFSSQQLTTSPIENPTGGHRYSFSQKGPCDTSWGQGPNQTPGPGIDPGAMLYNPTSQSPIGCKKGFNSYPSNPPMLGPVPPGPIVMQPPMAMSGPGVAGGGGHAIYDVERRPPKSSELFDPNGPSPSSSGSGQSDYVGGFRHQGYNDGGSVHGQDGQGMMMMGGSGQPQGSGFHGASFNGNFQPHPHPHPQPSPLQHQTQQPYNPVGMSRSYSSSSSTGYPAGGSNPKKNSLLYDYSVPTTSYDGAAKSSSPETERPPSLSHILEIYDFDVQDDIFEDLVLPPGARLRRLKPSAKDANGQCLVVFKTAIMASEALVAFQEGKETWMASETNLEFKRSEPLDPSSDPSETEAEPKESSITEAEEVDSSAQSRIQRRFNVRIWTPVLANTSTPSIAVSTGTASPGKNQTLSLATATSDSTAQDSTADGQDGNHCEDDHDNSDHGSPASSSSSLPSPSTASEPASEIRDEK